MPSFVTDGYVFHAGIDPIEGVHEGLEFSYRPMSPAETAEYINGADGLSGVKLRRFQAKKLCQKIQGWRSRTVGEKIPQLTEDILIGEEGPHINTVLLSQIVDVVIWGAAPDYTSDKDNYEDAVKN